MPNMMKREDLFALLAHTERHLLGVFFPRICHMHSCSAILNEPHALRDAIQSHVLLHAKRMFRSAKHLLASIERTALCLRIFPAKQELDETRKMPKSVVGWHANDARDVVPLRGEAKAKNKVLMHRLWDWQPTRYIGLDASKGV